MLFSRTHDPVLKAFGLVEYVAPVRDLLESMDLISADAASENKHQRLASRNIGKITNS